MGSSNIEEEYKYIIDTKKSIEEVAAIVNVELDQEYIGPTLFSDTYFKMPRGHKLHVLRVREDSNTGSVELTGKSRHTLADPSKRTEINVALLPNDSNLDKIRELSTLMSGSSPCTIYSTHYNWEIDNYFCTVYKINDIDNIILEVEINQKIGGSLQEVSVNMLKKLRLYGLKPKLVVGKSAYDLVQEKRNAIT